MNRDTRGTHPAAIAADQATRAPEVGPAARSPHAIAQPGLRRRVILRAGWGILILLASLAVGLLSQGCGKHSDEASSTGASTSQDVVVAEARGALAPSTSTGRKVAEPSAEGRAVSADSLPPEVAASVADTLVVPGSAVEITAQGSPDVSEVTLSDGLGKRQPFAYDSSTDVWKAYYRVPIKATSERVGLSVTAKNSASRWRRVWLFLSVERGAPKQATEAPDKP